MTSVHALPKRPATSRLQRPLDVFVAGIGNVGGALLDQIDALATNSESPSPLRLVGACTSLGAYCHFDGISASDVRARLSDAPPTDWPRLADQLVAHGEANPTVLVDATGHNDGADYVERLLAGGISVVTPSKLANTRSQAHFDRLIALGDGARAHYRYEATVGAGLPVISTVRDLIATGDRLLTVRGVFSGTMTFLFSQLEQGISFGDAVRRAYEQGYTEPDPRDDLGGEDVARKLIILARTAGLKVERSDVLVESLVPQSAEGLPVTLVTGAFADSNDTWSARVKNAEDARERLRYVGTIEQSEAGKTIVRVGVESVPADSPLGRLRGTDNLLELTTERYAHSPIVIQGPGAGPAVTAAGVLADLLSVARSVPR